jgi:2,4-dienoyl-CoA reductase-like NADH-dependent reductase (Old Yellow Enzyme family)/thioredoxin reductase
MNKLFESIKVSGIELKNRIVFPPMTTGFEEKGEVTEKSLNFYTPLAKGGAGLIIVGDVSVTFAIAPQPALYDDKFIPGLRTLTQSVQAYGAKISPQIFHQPFDFAEIMKLPREQAFAKMREVSDTFQNILTLDQIQVIQDKFVSAAQRAIAAGFDMLQVHGGQLIGQFVSPFLNERTDSYGGNLENRARFALEIVSRIKDVLGSDIPIDYKLTISRPNQGKSGPPLDEAKKFAKWLVDAGVDSLHVCTANHGGIHHIIPPLGSKPYGCNADLAEAIKEAVNVPITTVGRIIDPEFAEILISEGQADLVAVGRGLLADPEWPIKAKEGKYEDIRKCIMCNQGCTDNLLSGQSICCSINATLGNETTSQITKARNSKHVLIVGGGPGGMETARVAAIRGHKVTLMEKADTLGGQLNLASISPHKEEMNLITQYLVSQVNKLGIDVQPGKEVTAAMLAKMRPDVVVMATGAIPLIPNISGAKGKNVTTAWDVLAGKVRTGKHVIVVGGGSVGCETAEFLAKSDKEVTIVEMLDTIGKDMSPTVIPFFMERIKQYGIKVMMKHKLEEITEHGITTTDEHQHKHTFEADTVILAMGAQPNDELVKELQKTGVEVYAIGDCAHDPTRKLVDAIHEGYCTALKI